MKKLKYLLLIFIIFLTPNVFAQDFNVATTDITSPSGGGATGTYSGLEIYNGGSPAVYHIGTRYNGRLSRIWFNLIAGGYADADGFEKGHTYTLAMNMATQDWRNGFGNVSVTCEGTGNNLSNSRVTFVSMYKIKFSFTTPTDRYCRFVYIDLKSSDINSTYITGTSNWNLSSMVISDPAYSNGGSGSGSGSGSGTTDPNQTIIDNANQNTQDIITNNNNNTQDIIDNANQNAKDTQDAINKGLQSCHESRNLLTPNTDYSHNNITINGDGSILINGTISDNVSVLVGTLNMSSNYTYSYSTNIESTNANNSYYYVVDNGTYIYFRSNKTFTLSSNFTNHNLRLIVLAGTYNNLLLKPMFSATSSPIAWEPVGENICTSKLDETNSYLTDDSDPNIEDSEFTDLFNSVGFNDPLGYLLQLPVQFINQLVSQSNTCQTISLGTLWGVSLSLPCIDIGSIIGQQVWDIIDVLFSVGLLVVIFKNLYQTFANLMTMGGEKEAREKFSMPTPMEFLSIILGGDR